MSVSKTPIPLDDEETIRRFTEEMRRKSAPTVSHIPPRKVQGFAWPNEEGSTFSHVEHRATQTEPVMVIGPPPADGISHASSDRHVSSSQSKPKTVLDPVSSQSPKLSGVLAPPSTPETVPDLSRLEITQIIADAFDGLSSETTFGLGESRYAPKNSSQLKGRQPGLRSSTGANEYLSTFELQAANFSPPTTANISPQPSSGESASASPTTKVKPPPSPVLGKSVLSSRWACPSTIKAPELSSVGWATSTSFSPLPGHVIGKSKKISAHTAAEPVLVENLKPRSQEQFSEAHPTEQTWSTDQMHLTKQMQSGRSQLTEQKQSTDNNQSTEQKHLTEQKQPTAPKQGSVKPIVPKDDWLPPHLRPYTGSARDPRLSVPNRAIKPSQDPAENVVKEVIRTEAEDIKFVPPHLREKLQAPEPPAKVTEQVEPVREILSNIPIIRPSGSTKPTSTLQDSSAQGTAQTGSVLPLPSAAFCIVSPSSSDILAKSHKDREHASWFDSWGRPEPRLKQPARVRRVIISSLPQATPSLVASLVWGGPLEEIHVQNNSAVVTFAYASDCQNYYDATANGVAYQCEGREQVAFVHKGKDVDVVSGSLHNALEEGFTRCIRAVGDHPDPYTPQQLRAKAEFKNRKLEGMEMGVLETGVSYIIFRFCNMKHAIEFKGVLTRDEQWEHCSIHHVTDPCAQAKGVHLEK